MQHVMRAPVENERQSSRKFVSATKCLQVLRKVWLLIWKIMKKKSGTL